MSRTFKPPVIKPLLKPFMESTDIKTSTLTKPNGSVEVVGKMNGRTFIGKGPSQRLAALDMRKQLQLAVNDTDLVTR